MNDLITKIENWANNKGILKHATPQDQILKTIEEVGELAHAIGKNDRELIKDAIGDVLVTLIIQAKINNFHLIQDYIAEKMQLHFKPTFNVHYSVCRLCIFTGFILKHDLLPPINHNELESALFEIIGIAGHFNLTAEECLQHSYNIISQRSGKMINGMFVKDEQ